MGILDKAKQAYGEYQAKAQAKAEEQYQKRMQNKEAQLTKMQARAEQSEREERINQKMHEIKQAQLQRNPIYHGASNIASNLAKIAERSINQNTQEQPRKIHYSQPRPIYRNGRAQVGNDFGMRMNAGPPPFSMTDLGGGGMPKQKKGRFW